jgi:adenosylcobinamide-phosphate synthase
MSAALDLWILLVALLAEAAFGYPRRLLDEFGHPVMWFGRLIDLLEGRLNRPADSFESRRIAGVMALGLLLGATVGPALIVQLLVVSSLPGTGSVMVLGLLASSLLAQRSLHAHVADVARALDHDGVTAGRVAVSQIVGRDTSVLDGAGISRAALESLAENFSDGVTAPAIWCALGGLPGAVLYKAVNTADSMIGHRTARHEAFGWAAARLDDLLNLPASRLSALWIMLAAATMKDADPAAAWRAIWRDAPRHKSPNAGWPEAAMAGALGLRLNGPKLYGGKLREDAWMGSGREQASAADIRRGLDLYRRACAIQILVAGGLALAILR